MRKFRSGVHEDLAAAGRPTSACKILPAVMPFVGETSAEAIDKRDTHNALVDPMVGLSTLAAHANFDFSQMDLDAPVDQLRSGGTQGLIATVSRIAKDANMTLKDVGRRYGESVMVPQICGTGKEVAEQLAETFASGACDGFVISPAFLPDAFREFAEQVVPHLQRLGVFREEYRGKTLRDHLSAS
jgi:alkanesulfonate monooxygenase SsuD/methylene tetrahydromethanopterin reductase-like flavin-dependent oxidoreductase (luciferase family)